MGMLYMEMCLLGKIKEEVNNFPLILLHGREKERIMDPVTPFLLDQ